MKILFDLLPVILFFIVFKWGEGHANAAQSFLHDYIGNFISSGASVDQAPIMLATLVSIIATLLQIALLLIRRKKIDGMLWISFLVVSIMGGLTIYFHNETFIKWKLTMLYWSYALALIFSQIGFKKNLTRTFLAMLETELAIPEPTWTRLNYVWMAFFLGMGCLNLIIAYNFSTDVWVNFKLFGSMGCMFVFLLSQIIYLSRFSKPSEENP